MNFQELETQIKELIAKDNIETAIELLTEYFQKDERLDEIILQSGIYFSAIKNHEKGVIGFEELNKTLKQLRANILSYLKSEEEEIMFKNKVFNENSQAKDDDTLIPVFFSLGSPHTSAQADYIEKLRIHLLKYQIELVALDGDDWNNLDPLNPIQNKMKGCFGCLSLALERSFVKEGINKRGSHQEVVFSAKSYATPWIHIETTMAYQLDLPFIILKEKGLNDGGMLDDNIFEWRIVMINPNHPDELDEYPVKSFIRMWVEEVKKFQGKTHT